jgi:site-specific recombinase XerD
MSKANSLKPHEIKRVLKTCLLMQDKEMKRCVIVLSYAAMRVTEISLIEVKSLLYPSGLIREEIHLPSKICKSLKPRTIWLTNKLSRQVVQEWIDYRLKRRWGLSGDDKYQGLNPNSKMIFNNRGRAYSIQPQPRKMTDNTIKIYLACDALESIIRTIYKRCGLKAASSHSGRKSLVTNAVLNGTTLEQMARILGHDSVETTIQYVVIDQDRIKEILAIEWL